MSVGTTVARAPARERGAGWAGVFDPGGGMVAVRTRAVHAGVAGDAHANPSAAIYRAIVLCAGAVAHVGRVSIVWRRGIADLGACGRRAICREPLAAVARQGKWRRTVAGDPRAPRASGITRILSESAAGVDVL